MAMLPIILQATTFEGVEAALLPLVIVALLLDSAIISIWYVLGSLLNNATVKTSARDEFYQLGGTALLTVVIIALLTTFSSAFYNVLGSTKLLNPTVTSSICQGIMANSKLEMLGSNGAIMSGSGGGAPAEATSSFPGLCRMVDPNQLQTMTTQMDYPLAVTGVIIANLTNQTITNLNSAFVVDSFLGFLANLAPEIRLCISTPEAYQCVTPIPNPAVPTFYLGISFAPYAGMDFIYKSLADYGTMLTNAYTLFIAQLTFIVVFVFIWPYLIFIGLVLRSTPFTRGVGGLLIAVAIGMVLFYPLVYSIEYLALGNWSQQQSAAGSVATTNAIYGYNFVTSIPGRDAVVCPGETVAPSCSGGGTPACSNKMPFSPICVTTSGATGGATPIVVTPTGETPTCPPDPEGGTVKPTCNYTVNFFVQPNMENVALSKGCWPMLFGKPTTLNAAEFADIGTLLIPLYSAVAPLISLLGSTTGRYSIPNIPLPAGCTPDAALQTFEAMIQSFGVLGISAYLLPVLNLVITLSAILGVSGLLGGDTSLAGISKLL